MPLGETKIEFASDSSVMIATADPLEAFCRILGLKDGDRADLLAIENLHPAYDSLLVDFDPSRVRPNELIETLRSALSSPKDELRAAGRVVEICVSYGGLDGPDLADVARHTGLMVEDVIRLHSAPIYEVAFLGFSPGFPYLTGLNPKLQCPRKPVPRLKVPAGSVAIAGLQAGIYPETSPGGWQVIGRTTAKLFDPRADEPTLLSPGDKIRFVPAGAR